MFKRKNPVFERLKELHTKSLELVKGRWKCHFQDMRNLSILGRSVLEEPRAKFCGRLGEELRRAGITSASRVVELGAGGEENANQFRKAGYDITTIDLVKEGKPGTKHIIARAEYVPLPANHADFVYSRVLLDFTDKAPVLQEAMRILKPGARFFAEIGHPELTKWFEKKIGRIPSDEETLRRHFQDYLLVSTRFKSVRDVKKQFSRAGFRDIATEEFFGEGHRAGMKTVLYISARKPPIGK